MTPYELGRQAALTNAYQDGVKLAMEEAGLEKEAVLGLLSGIARFGGAALRGIGSVARGAGALMGGGRAMAGAAEAGSAAMRGGETMAGLMRQGGGFMKTVGNPAMEAVKGGWGNAMKPISSAWNSGNVGQAAWQAAKSPLGKDMLIGGAMNGGIAAATAEPGDRMGAGLKGFGWGAAGGAAFKGVHGLATGARATAPMQAALNNGGFMKRWGLKGLTHPFALGTAASMALPTGMPEAPKGMPMSNLPNAAMSGVQ
jgi:hypothetical protein